MGGTPVRWTFHAGAAASALPPLTATTRRASPWRPSTLFLAAGSILSGLALWAGPRPDVTILMIIGVAGAVAVLAGVAVFRPHPALPWYLLATGQGLLAAGGVAHVTAWHAGTGADVGLVAYPMVVTGAGMLVRCRRGPGSADSRANCLDTFIVSLASGLLAWVLLLSRTNVTPYLAERYACDLVLFGFGARLVLDSGMRGAAERMLTAGIAAFLATEAAAAVSTEPALFMSLRLSGAVLLGLSAGGAALHPSMVRVSQKARQHAVQGSLSRMGLLAAAALAVPTADLVGVGTPHGRVLAGAGSAAVLVLVFVRMATLARQRERAAASRVAIVSQVAGGPGSPGVAVPAPTLPAPTLPIAAPAQPDSISHMAGGLAHDFNNILSAIQMYANILDRGLQAQAREGAGDPARCDKMVREVGKIREVANRGSTLVNQLLLFGREVDVPAEILDLNQSIRGLEELIRDTLGSQIVLHTRLDPAGTGVAAGPDGHTNMERVLMNLVINARDAMARGGTLTIQTDTVDVDANAAVGVDLKPGRYVRLSVSDTGTGMTRETRHRAFEPFFTTKPSGPGPGHGTGLGLATVRGIVNQAGGDVQLYSEPDFGTLVRVFLPSVQARISPQAATPPAPDRPHAERRQAAARVLLAGFGADRQESARATLASSGYSVLTAATAHDALAASQRCPGPIHLLIVDLRLPGMTACELAQRLHIARPGLKVLTVAETGQVFLDAALGLPTVHLASPFGAEDLRDAVRQALAAPPWDPSRLPSPDASVHPTPVADRPGSE